MNDQMQEITAKRHLNIIRFSERTHRVTKKKIKSSYRRDRHNTKDDDPIPSLLSIIAIVPYPLSWKLISGCLQDTGNQHHSQIRMS